MLALGRGRVVFEAGVCSWGHAASLGSGGSSLPLRLCLLCSPRGSLTGHHCQ